MACSPTPGLTSSTTASLYVPGNDAYPPDGTAARRMQISARFIF
jgi:hypothetical protein